MFAGVNTLLSIITGFVDTRIYACKGCKLTALGEFMHIAYFF